jgi:hypothetical protein
VSESTLTPVPTISGRILLGAAVAAMAVPLLFACFTGRIREDRPGTFRSSRPVAEGQGPVNQTGHPVRYHPGYPAGKKNFSAPHPATCASCQYAGLKPAERRRLRKHEPAIGLIRLAKPAAGPDDPPVASRPGETDSCQSHDSHG